MGSPAGRCGDCGVEISAELLACPSCSKLLHADALKALAAQAEAAEKAGDLSTALTAWRDTLDLLPPNTRQHAVILQRIQGLSARVDEGRPMTNGIIMWGKTTTSRSGTMGSVS